MMTFLQRSFPFAPTLLLLILFGCSVPQELTDISRKSEYEDYVDRYAPTEDAFVAVQRLAKPYLDRNDWNGAIDIFEKYKAKFPKMGSRFEKIIYTLREPQANVTIQNLGGGINTQYDEIKPNPTADGTRTYFASKDRPGGFGGLDLYVAKREGENWGQAVNLGANINTKEHESINSISTDGTRIVLYGAFEGHMGRGDNFYFEKTPQGWSRIKNFPPPINSPDFESDGFFTPDGKAFLFTSDRDGVIGKRQPKGDADLKQLPFHGSYGGNTDVFVCIKQGSGWSAPVNLGPVINTPYCERSAFLHPDGKTLYFSSDGHYGMGKLDVFKSVRQREDVWTEWSAPVNLGKEINTSEDDWGYKISTDGQTSYFSASGKMGGFGQSDLLSISLPKEVQPEEKVIAITGKVTDEDGNPINKGGELNWDDLAAKKWHVTNDSGKDVKGGNEDVRSWEDLANRGLNVRDHNGGQINGTGDLSWDELNKNKWSLYDKDGNLIPGNYNALSSWDDLSKRGWKVYDENGNIVNGSGDVSWDDINKNRWKIYDRNGNQIVGNPNSLQSWADVKRRNWKIFDANGNLIAGDGDLSWDDIMRNKWRVVDGSGYEVNEDNTITWADINANRWRVFDENGNPISGSGTILWDDHNAKKNLGESQIDPQTGEFTFYLPLGRKYDVSPNIDGFYPDTKILDLTNLKDPRDIRLDFKLNSVEGMKRKRDKWGNLLAQRVENIFFDFNKYDLKPESFTALDQLTKFLEYYPTINVIIAAHTDNIGTDDYNLKLSEKRAQSVVDYLLRKKLNHTRLEAKGYGKTRPVADNTTEEGRAQNRRVEFRIQE